MVNRIIHELTNKGFKVDGLIQHSYNPHVNDAIQFFIYSGNQISHIASTYRFPSDSWKLMHDQNDLMKLILKKIQDTSLKENILFSTWLLDLPQGCFRIQEFKKMKFYYRATKHNLADFQKYLDISCSWIVDVHKVTSYETAPVDHSVIKKRIKSEIANFKDAYSKQLDVLCLLVLLENRLEAINTPVMLGMHHGDYCYWNCFIDDYEIYRVIDWEFAQISELVIIDYLTNLIVIWIGLKKNKLVGSVLRCFFYPLNDEERLLSQTLYDYKCQHSLNDNEIKLYLVYVFMRLFLRKARPTSRKHWEEHLADMMSVLNSIDLIR